MLEGCRHHGVEHLVYASTSAVYGANRKLPFSVSDAVDHPVSLYGATKKANELMAHSYAHLFGLPVTGLRFFTVYGPWGRPDMSLFLFTRKILAGEPIKVFNYGQHARDFTYIDDAVEGVVRTLDVDRDPRSQLAPRGAGPRHLVGARTGSTISAITAPLRCSTTSPRSRRRLGKKAKIELVPQQPGDVEETYADVEALKQATGFRACDAARRGHRALRRLVSRLLPGVIGDEGDLSRHLSALKRSKIAGLAWS